MSSKMLPSGPVVALASVLGLMHCHSPEPVAPAPPLTASEAAPPPVAASAEPSTMHNTANEQLKSLDEADLMLFKRIEHDTNRDVPDVARALVASKHQGATREALVSEMDKSVEDAKLRSLLNQWLDESFGTAGGPKPPAPGTTAGAGPSMVKPLKSK